MRRTVCDKSGNLGNWNVSFLPSDPVNKSLKISMEGNKVSCLWEGKKTQTSITVTHLYSIKERK